MQAWSFSGQLSSELPSYRPTAPGASDPAGPRMGSLRSVIHARFRLPTSRVPFSQNLLSRKGSPGCSLCSVHEASDFPHFPTVIRAEREGSGYWRGSTVCTIGAIGRRMGPASPATFGGAPQIRRICIVPWRSKSPATHDWLRATKRAMCVSLGQQIARLEEEHI